jgi:hypothetical protein
MKKRSATHVDNGRKDEVERKKGSALLMRITAPEKYIHLLD